MSIIPLDPKRRTPHDQVILDRDHVEIYVCHGCEGDSIVINDRRVGGPKAWGGGSVGTTWKAKKKDVLAALGLEETATEARSPSSVDAASDTRPTSRLAFIRSAMPDRSISPGRRLLMARFALDLTQVEFGQRLRPERPVSAFSIHGWESGVRAPHASNRKAIEDLTGIPAPDWDVNEYLSGVPGDD